MKKLVLVLLLSVACLVAAFAQSGKRVALVIGNAAYKADPLASPVNDAQDMAAALVRLGFSPVILKTNLDFRGMSEAVDQFEQAAQGAEEAVYYYSGHGTQASGENYFVPVGMKCSGENGKATEKDLKWGALSQGYVTDSLKQSKVKASIIILDACRSFTVQREEKSSVSGLASYAAPRGSVVFYATQPGAVASAGDGGRNSIFTAALLRRIETPGLSIAELAALVTQDVDEGTGGKQTPSTLSNLVGQYFFKGGQASVAAPAVPAGFVFVPGGTFTMGSPPNEEGRSDGEVQHQVTLSSFAMSKFDVTVGEFRRFIKATGYKTSAELVGGAWVHGDGLQVEQKAEANWRNPGFRQGETDPVVCVSWYDAIAYCNWRSVAERKGTAYSYKGSQDFMTWPSGWNIGTNNNIGCNFSASGYRLPTEAEWEYAAKGGQAASSLPMNAVYAGSIRLEDVAWCSSIALNTTHPVGMKKPNILGLYDLEGNVWQYCWDWLGDYSLAHQRDPHGPASGSARVVRGGSWYIDYAASDYRSASRLAVDPCDPIGDGGFRLVCSQGDR